MTMQATPTTQSARSGDPQVLSVLASASPASPIGIVPITIPKANLSARSVKSRRASADNEPNTMSRTSGQKYAMTAARAASCIAAENADPGSCHPNNAGTMRICAVEEIGISSVMP